MYYAVESFDGYGQLSGNSVAELKGGAGGRVVARNTAGKRHPADFLLWKPDPSHLMKWDPRQWGLRGRARGIPGGTSSARRWRGRCLAGT